MYSSKKEVDNHVRIALSKIRTEKDRALRGLTIAKLYFKIKEYASAEQYICSYLKVKDDNEQAHKMLGQCYQFLKQPLKALQEYQRSLQLNPKQPDLLADVCQLLVEDEQMNANKAKYWCELAETEKVENESVYALRMKLINQSNVSANEIESILRKEISTRPDDVNPRVRLIRHFIDQQQIIEAFKYIHDFELQQHEEFSYSSEWYNIVWLVLSKYEQLPDTKKDWDFWLLVAMCLDRLVFLSFITINVTETANLLFRFDQYLFKITQLSEKFQIQRELAALFLEHYRSQLLMHAVSLLFKRELMQKKNKWRETLQLSLPFLLLAYHSAPRENKEPWMKHCDEKSAKLVQLWYREGAFRCAQAGRVLLSCTTDENKENQIEIQSVFGTQSGALWTNTDELLAHIRQTCVDKQWRRNAFSQIFCNSDQKLKEQTSLLVKSTALAEPLLELPTFATLEGYEEIAQYLRPKSLRHIVYLHLSYGDLSQVRAKYFSGLNFSTSNISFCGGESLNQLDVDSYLYAAIIENQRGLEMNREISDCYSSQGNIDSICRPQILPFVNMQEDLCNDEQLKWWSFAYKVYKNLTETENAAQIRADLQTGIEVVRGINGPRMDMHIVFKLGKIFSMRAKNIHKPVERSFLEARAECLYLHGLKMLKLHNRNVLEPFRKTFKYRANSNAAERELNEIAEQAVLYLSERMLKQAQYEELIDEMNGIPLPFATYKQAEAYRKMIEASKTSKTAKQRFTERASDCLQQTLTLLKSTNFNTNHPLNSTIHTELKRLHNNVQKYHEDSDEFSSLADQRTTPNKHNNSSTYEDAQTEFFSPALNRSTRRDRDVVASLIAAANASPQQNTAHSNELESLVKQMVNTLTLVKEELVCGIKPEVLSMRQEIISLNDKVAQLEDSMKKMRTSSGPPSRDDGSNVLDDLYIIDDALQNQLYQQSQQATQMFPPHPNGNNANTATNSSFGGALSQTTNQQSTATQRNIQTSSALQMQQQTAAAAAAAAFNNPLLNTNYPFNYYPYPYMLTQQGATANSLLGPRNQMGMPYMEQNTNLNFNIPATTSLFPPAAPGAVAPQPTAPQVQPPIMPPHVLNDGRANNMFSLLNPMQSNPTPLPLTQSTLPALSLPTHTILPLAQSINTSPLLPNATTTVTFNKALNNQPVEKGPPANVVITSSDPLPNPRNVTQLQQQQPTLSVTIPSHHIKSSLVQTPELAAASFTPQPNSVMSSGNVNFFGNNATGSNNFTFGGMDATSNFINSFSFKPAVEQALAANNSAAAAAAAASNAEKSSNSSAPLNDSTLNELNKSLDTETAEYDPRPDFQPIIPLPNEIEVRTGEEDEEIMFCEHAKLYRFVDKEWKERGIGTLKILKGKDQRSRILMRRDQTHKICANHKITKDLKLKTELQKNGHTWPAFDFADGEMKQEIFYVRFKQQQLARKFQDAFIQAQKEDESLDAEQEKNNKKVESSTAVPPAPFGLTKSAVTTFATSTPTTGSPLTKTNNDDKKKTTPNTPFTNKPLFSDLNLAPTFSVSSTSASVATTTASPFAKFSFNTISSTSGTTQPFAGLATMASTATTPFGSTLFGKPIENTASPFSVANLQLTSFGAKAVTNEITPKPVNTNDTTTNSLNKTTASDTEEEYEPTAQFKPVITLPELVEVTTGEENYKQLFEHRAKLLRFDKETREWKERGIGNVRLLQHQDNKDDVRLVMRREQIHKLCCNQRLYKDIEFKYAKNSQTAVQWVGHDYSEGELNTEFLTLRFKTSEICKDFYDTLIRAQAEMSNKCTMQANEQNSKPNDPVSTTKSNKDANAAEKKGFGDAFKPKAGSWTCQGCYVINPADILYCQSCDTPKDDTVQKKEATKNPFAPSTGTLFNFGFSNATQVNATAAQTTFSVTPATGPTNSFAFGDQTKPTLNITATAPITSITTSTTKNDFGDKFKHKPGTWDCKDCYTNNAVDRLYCIACEAPKDSSVPKKETTAYENVNANKNILALSDPTQKFSFGFPAATATATTQAVSSTEKSIFGTTATNQPLTTLSKPTFSFNLQSKAMTSPTLPTDTGINVSAPFSLNKKEFTFTMTAKNSEAESPKISGGGFGGDDAGDADDSSHLQEEEENNTYFTPVIPLPDKIDVKTGEEDEEILYQHRAKLYRLTDGEWKERGIGDVKILRHKTTKKLRVIMRRDQIHKICLNHALNSDVKYKSKDDKSWLFVVNNYSEGEVQLEKLILRFKTKDIAEDFMSVIKRAMDSSTVAVQSNGLNGHLNEKPIKEDKIHTLSNKTENNTDKIGDEMHWPLVQPELNLPNSINNSPLGNRSFLLKQSALSPSTKVEDIKTLEDTTKKTEPINFSFKAALQENKDAKTISTPASGGFLFGSDSTGSVGNKIESSIFSGGAGKQPLFGQAPSIFGSGNITSPKETNQGVATTVGSPSNFIFGEKFSFGNTAPPSTANPIFGGNAATEPKSTFFSTPNQTPSIFSTGTTGTINNSMLSPATQQSIFSVNNANTSSISGSIFGGAKPLNTLTDTSKTNKNNGSLFGGFAVTVGEKTNNNSSDETKAISFAELTAKSGALDFASLAAANNNKPSTESSDKSVAPAGFIGLTNQDAFSSFLKTSNKNTSKDQSSHDSNANEADGDDTGTNDENYDPRYDPIIPLPKEIVLSTGEEDEEKIFSERAVLFRYDADSKDWKERGVGEIKLLKHSAIGRFRLVLRREQIHKLVLNFPITENFKFDTMKNNPKSFLFVGLNYAESTKGEYEKLALRFKKIEIATEFSKQLNACLEAVQQQVKAE